MRCGSPWGRCQGGWKRCGIFAQIQRWGGRSRNGASRSGKPRYSLVTDRAGRTKATSPPALYSCHCRSCLTLGILFPVAACSGSRAGKRGLPCVSATSCSLGTAPPRFPRTEPPSCLRSLCWLGVCSTPSSPHPRPPAGSAEPGLLQPQLQIRTVPCAPVGCAAGLALPCHQRRRQLRPKKGRWRLPPLSHTA